MRRDVLIALEEAARLDTLPIDACRPDETVTPILLNASRLYSLKASAGSPQHLKPAHPE